MRFEIYKDRKGGFRWRLRARNTKILADSGESYTRKIACQRGMKAVQASSSETPVFDLTIKLKTK